CTLLRATARASAPRCPARFRWLSPPSPALRAGPSPDQGKNRTQGASERTAQIVLARDAAIIGGVAGRQPVAAAGCARVGQGPRLAVLACHACLAPGLT